MTAEQRKPATATEGLRLREAARQQRARADNVADRDPTGARWDRRDAADADRRADEILTLPEVRAIGAGGELHLSRVDASEKPGLACTVADPDLVTVEASRDRLELAADAGALALAVDTADTIRAGNSIEKMLSHQLAAAHTLAMRLTGRADMHSRNAAPDAFGQTNRAFHAVEAARAANAAARMMEAFQRGLLTLDRLRNGGRQTVVVQHVAVGEGGQAIVAGTLKGGGQAGGHPEK